MWRFLFLVLALGGGAAFFTNPSHESSKEALSAMVVEAVNSQDISLDKSAAGNALLLGCKLRPSECQKVVASQLTTHYSDYKLFSTLSAEGLGHTAWCIGGFTKLTCPSGISPK